MIGKAIKKLGIPRSKIVLMTKCWGVLGEKHSMPTQMLNKDILKSADYVNQGGLSRQAIFNAVDQSLERLQTDYIDLFHIHRYDHTVPIEETMRALDDLVRMGKVRYIGASSMWTFEFQEMQNVAAMNGWTKFISMQNQYSLCYREEEREMIQYCKKTGVGLMSWSPMYAGKLARPLGQETTVRAEWLRSKPYLYLSSDADDKIIERVHKLAEKKDWKMCQVALEWVVQRGHVPIVGVDSISRLDEASDLRGRHLTAEELQWLEEPYIPRAVTTQARTHVF